MPFLHQQSMPRHPLHNSTIAQKFFLRVKILFLVQRPGRKSHWPSSNIDSTIFRHFLLNHLAYIFPGRLKVIFFYKLHTVYYPPFLYMGMISRVCQSFGVFASFHAT